MADMIRPEDIRRIISDSDRRRPGDERAPEPLTRRTAVDEPQFDDPGNDYGEAVPAAVELDPPSRSQSQPPTPDPEGRLPSTYPEQPQARSTWIDPPQSREAAVPRPAPVSAPEYVDPDAPVADQQPYPPAARPQGRSRPPLGGYDGPPLDAPSSFAEEVPEESLEEEVFEEAPPRRKRRFLLPLLGGVLLFLIAGAALVLFGDPGQRQVAGVDAPTLKAQVEVDKVKPDVPGGLQVPNRDVQVLDQTAASNEPEAIVLQPPPEEPAPVPPVPQVAQPEAEPVTPTEPAEDQIAAIIQENEGDAGLAGTAPSADRLAAPGLAIPPRPSAKLDGREAAVAAALGGSAPAAETPAAEATTAPATTASATTGSSGQAAASDGFLVQLASLTSPEAAERSWQTMSTRHGTELSGLSHSVQKIEIEGRGTFYRLRAGPFADRAAADARCQQLKDKGQACIVVAP